MMRNLSRLTNAANRIEAWKDWRAIKRFAVENGKTDLADSCQPPDDAGWRKIDKCIVKLRTALMAEGIEAPPNPSCKGVFL